MICPHCGKETGESGFIVKPARMKNLQITSWCVLCKKPKGYSGILVMGDTTDEDAQEVPATCNCAFYQQQAPAYTLIP